MGAPVDQTKKDEKGFPVLFHSTRFFVLFLTVGCLTFCLANPIILNFTVICMDDIIPEDLLYSNSTETQHWIQNAKLRNLLFSASAIGNLLGTFPITFLMQRFGTKTMFMVYGIISALATASFPLAVWTDIYALIFLVRIFQGFAMSFTMSACGAVCSSWSPIKEYGTYMSVLSMHFQFSPIFTMPVSAAFCVTPMGWRGVFYLQAVITAVMFGLFYIFYKDDPALHRQVSGKELSKISRNKEPEPEDRAVPYMAICTYPCVIGVWLSTIGGNFGFQMLLQFGPIYLNKVLNFEVASTGMATALPYILSAILKIFTGPLSDKSTCLSERAKIIVFASMSQGFMAFCFFIMATTSNALFSQLCYTAAIVFSGLNIIGVVRCAQLVARQYMPFVMAVVNGLLCIINLILPSLVATVASENKAEQWSLIFYGTVAMIVASNAYFLIVASAEPAPWTKADYKKPSKVLDKQDTVSTIA